MNLSVLQTEHTSCRGNPLKQKHICMLIHKRALPCHGSVQPGTCFRVSSQNQGLSIVGHPPSCSGVEGVTDGPDVTHCTNPRSFRGQRKSILSSNSSSEHRSVSADGLRVYGQIISPFLWTAKSTKCSGFYSTHQTQERTNSSTM